MNVLNIPIESSILDSVRHLNTYRTIRQKED